MGENVDFGKLAAAVQKEVNKSNKGKKIDEKGPGIGGMLKGMGKEEIQLIASMIPKKVKVLLGFAIFFVLYGLVSSVLDAISLTKLIM